MTGAPLSGVGPVTIGDIALDGDVRAHALHFAGMQIAIFEDGFADVRHALGLRGKRHELRLHVCGEAGIFLGSDVGGHQLFRGFDAQGARAFAANVHAAFLSLSMSAPRWLGIAVFEQQFAAGDGPGDEKSAGLDAVGNDGVRCAVKLFDALHADGRCAARLRFSRPFW